MMDARPRHQRSIAFKHLFYYAEQYESTNLCLVVPPAVSESQLELSCHWAAVSSAGRQSRL